MQVAKLQKRIAAGLIDGILIVFLFFICALPCQFLLERSTHIFSTLTKTSVNVVIFFLVFVLYYALAEKSRYQATFGKTMLGLKVTDVDGQPVSLGKSLLRNGTKIFSILFLCLGYLTCLYTPKKQGWHDMAADCLVVDAFAQQKMGSVKEAFSQLRRGGLMFLCTVAGMGVGLYVLLMSTIAVGVFCPETIFATLQKGYSYKAIAFLEMTVEQQKLYYKQHGRYATQWDQLKIPNLCPQNPTNSCDKFGFYEVGDFTLELMEQGVAVAGLFNAAFFHRYDRTGNQSRLFCQPWDEGARTFCRDRLHLPLATSQDPETPFRRPVSPFARMISQLEKRRKMNW